MPGSGNGGARPVSVMRVSARSRSSTALGRVLAAAAGLFALVVATPSSAQLTGENPGAGTTAETPEAAPAPTEQGPAQPAKKPKTVGSSGTSWFSPSFLWDFRLGLAETFTTNVAGATSASHAASTDYLSRLDAGADLHEHSGRINADLTYTGNVTYFATTRSTFTFANHLIALGNADLWHDYLTFNLRLFAEPVFISPLGNITPPGVPPPRGANSNIRDTYGFEASPEFSLRFGDYALSQFTPNYSEVFYVQPVGAFAIGGAPPPSVTSYGATEVIRGGPFFNRLRWTINGSDQEDNRSALGLKQRSGNVELEYFFDREFALLGTVGYTDVGAASALSHKVTGPVGLVGAIVNFGRSQATIEAGEQFRNASLMGSAHVYLGPFTELNANITDTITGPGGRLFQGLNDLAATPQGQLYDTNYAVGAVPSQVATFTPIPLDSLGFSNVISRFRDARATLTYELMRTHLLFTTFATKRDLLTAPAPGESAHQTTYGIDFGASRQFAIDFTGGFHLTFRNERIFVGSDNNITATINGNYNLSPTIELYGNVEYLTRLSSNALAGALPTAGNTNTFAATIGIRKTFTY